jgi:two-component system, sensor histidine kinase and response regulator
MFVLEGQDQLGAERKEGTMASSFTRFDKWKLSEGPIMAIVDSTPSGICITDESGVFEYVNPAYCSIYGYEPEELIGRHFTMIVAENQRPWLIELHDKFIAGTTEVRGEWPVLNKAGRSLFILADAVRIIDGAGRPKKVTFVTDITARKKIEDELAQSENLLREVVATKDKFASIIAHDLRNSFQILGMSAELLMMEARELSSVGILARAGNMLQTSQAAFELLTNLLAWAQSQTGTIEYQPVELNLLATVRSSIKPIEEKALAKNIRIKVDIPGALFVCADQNMLKTIVLNLLGNALKFTDSGESVTISAHEDPDSFTVAVCDSGIGMSEEKLDQLFRADCKCGSLGTNGETGTGLGLLLCKEFVEKNGGRIWVQSKKGEGSTFSFSLPKKDRMNG